MAVNIGNPPGLRGWYKTATRNLGRDLLEQLQPFRARAIVGRAEPGGVAARPGRAVDETAGNGIDDCHEYDGDGAGRIPQRHHDLGRRSQDHVRGKGDHLGHLPAHLLRVAPGPANVDLRVAADSPTRLLQSLKKGSEPRLPLRIFGREIHEHANSSHPAGGLLRPRRERPRRRRAAEQRDELAADHHSITSSARASTVGGTSRPSALAVLRLMTSSNFVGCTTGRSPGWAPFRTRPV